MSFIDKIVFKKTNNILLIYILETFNNIKNILQINTKPEICSSNKKQIKNWTLRLDKLKR